MGKSECKLLLLQPGLSGICDQQQSRNIRSFLQQLKDNRVLLHQLQSNPAEIRQTRGLLQLCNNGGYRFLSDFAIIQLEGNRRDVGGLFQHAKHLTGSLACPGNQRQYGDTETFLKDVGIHLNAACFGDIGHIQSEDRRLAVFQQLQRKQQVPFQLRGIDNIDKRFRGFFDQILCGYALIAGEG